jgi:hypothetical protein
MRAIESEEGLTGSLVVVDVNPLKLKIGRALVAKKETNPSAGYLPSDHQPPALPLSRPFPRGSTHIPSAPIPTRHIQTSRELSAPSLS